MSYRGTVVVWPVRIYISYRRIVLVRSVEQVLQDGQVLAELVGESLQAGPQVEESVLRPGQLVDNVQELSKTINKKFW